MYRIGQFSKMAKVTVKALRFYEEEGLFEPEYIDAANGYRYYSTDQLPRVFKIASLRQCGFSIPEIRSILAGRDIPSIFARRKRELEVQALATAKELASINHYMENIGRGKLMPYQVMIKDLPACLVFSKRLTVDGYDDYFDVFPALGEAMAVANSALKCVEDPPYCFLRYHDGEAKEHDIDVEICESIIDRGNGVAPEGVIFKNLERVPEAACVLHKGPYATLPEAYAAVYKWIEYNDYIPTEPPRESYIDGIWNKESDEDWLTEIQVPISTK